MALDQSTILAYARNRVYGTGLGEKPSIRQTLGSWTDAGGGLYTFAAADATEAGKIKGGHMLSSRGATSLAASFTMQVLGVSGTTVTCALDQGTAPTGSVGLLEHGAQVTEYDIFVAINDIVESYLFPHIYDIATSTFAPDIAYGQSEANALDEEVLRAWQTLGGQERQIPITLTKNLDSTQFTSGKMFSYNALTGTDVAVSTIRRVSLATSTDTRLQDLIGKGAAALVVEGAEQAANWEYSKNDARERPPMASRSLWSSFFTARQLLADDLSRNRVTEIVVSR